MSYASSSALRKRMAAPIGMRNNGIQPTKFLANFWELPTSPEHFCPNSKLHFFEPNISPYQDIEEILRLFKATWYDFFFLQSVGYTWVCLIQFQARATLEKAGMSQYVLTENGARAVRTGRMIR